MGKRLIYADELLQEFEIETVIHRHGELWHITGIKAFIENAPTIDQYGTWIPCSERLPEEPEENPEFDGKPLELYLVSVNDEEYPFRAFWNGKCFTDGAFKVNAVAWMPLPDRYRKEKR